MVSAIDRIWIRDYDSNLDFLVSNHCDGVASTSFTLPPIPKLYDNAVAFLVTLPDPDRRASTSALLVAFGLSVTTFMMRRIHEILGALVARFLPLLRWGVGKNMGPSWVGH